VPVFSLIIAMDVLTALLALFVLKPWRVALLGDYSAVPLAVSPTPANA
jgi:hypothetical protein